MGGAGRQWPTGGGDICGHLQGFGLGAVRQVLRAHGGPEGWRSSWRLPRGLAAHLEEAPALPCPRLAPEHAKHVATSLATCALGASCDAPRAPLWHALAPCGSLCE